MTDINYFSQSASVSGADRKQYLIRKAIYFYGNFHISSSAKSQSLQRASLIRPRPGSTALPGYWVAH
eukprot:365365-Chlamydomonas_euryale.AAC.11